MAWITLDRFSAQVAAADAPWAYLWTAVQNALVVETAAASLLSQQAVRRARREWPNGVQRLEDDELDRACSLGQLDGSRLGSVPDEPSPAVATLVRILAGSDAARVDFWTDAVGRALDVMADARRSYEETNLRRDVYLCDVLELDADELAALAALLIGPRRGNRADHSMLLALHRNPGARPEDVTGAAARIALLRAHGSSRAGQRHDAA
ncbi:hypothetical protein [Cellulomonas humilata]|uniref:Uncharacterized protein n=1 Tax=Cellulomonas humilata TaxID=144055 RepID=A0ABU0EKZ0_9CELL|nr:hypothetical protein [Cellulomonas humilata]MDQ0375957.1 hypothetical protein [Cellulomonas humilata]